MHEILFRGKRVDNGEWVEGCLATYPDGKARIFKTSSGGNCHNGLFDVIPETIGQFTGLTDKNGKRIFDGDVFKVSYNDWKYVVTWQNDNSRYLGIAIGGERQICYVGMCDRSGKSVVEIIGNAHDNPELLEGEVD